MVEAKRVCIVCGLDVSLSTDLGHPRLYMCVYFVFCVCHHHDGVSFDDDDDDDGRCERIKRWC